MLIVGVECRSVLKEVGSMLRWGGEGSGCLWHINTVGDLLSNALS